MECWSTGVLEFWKNKPEHPEMLHCRISLVLFLQYSITPLLHYSNLSPFDQLRSFASFGNGFVGELEFLAMIDMIFMVQKEP